MIFKENDLVTRKKYNHDTVFKILKIEEDKVYLKGLYVRLLADTFKEDLELIKDTKDDFKASFLKKEDRDEYFYLPGKILHIDSDEEYLKRCLDYYKENKIFAIGKKIKEAEAFNQIPMLLDEFKPDIIVITGHDSIVKNSDITKIENYKNSLNFIRSIKAARKYEKSHEKLVIIAGACQSDYEALIKAGANFASSPARVNIHALDPAIIASCVALTKKGSEINIKEVLNKTKYGPAGIGGIITNGLMYVGYPR